MSIARTFVARSLRLRPALTTTPSLSPITTSPQFQRAFTKPTHTALSIEDEEKHRADYEKHRVKVEPSSANIDESITFHHPQVCHHVTISSRPTPLSINQP